MQPDRRGTIFEVGLPSTATKTTCNFRVKYDDFVIGDGAYNTPMESTAAVEAARSKGRAGMVVVGKTMRYTYDQLKMLYVHTLQAVPVNAVEEGGGGAKVMSTAQGTLSTTTTTTTTGVSKKGISRAMQFSPPLTLQRPLRKKQQKRLRLRRWCQQLDFRLPMCLGHLFSCRRPCPPQRCPRCSMTVPRLCLRHRRGLCRSTQRVWSL